MFLKQRIPRRMAIVLTAMAAFTAGTFLTAIFSHPHSSVLRVEIEEKSTGTIFIESSNASARRLNKRHECTKAFLKNQTWPWLMKTEFLEQFEDALKRVSKCAPSSEHHTVVITVVDRGYVEMLETFMEHVKRFTTMHPIVFVSMDRLTHELLLRRDLVSVLNTDLGRAAASHSSFQTDGWRRKGHIKFKMATIAVQLGYATLVNDLDITYFRDPFPYLNCFDCDVEIQSDQDLKHSPVNSGFTYLRPTKRTQDLLVDMSVYMESHPWIWDQMELNERLNTHVQKHGLKRRLLPFDMFTPGKIHEESMYMYYDPSYEIFNRIVLVHHLHQAYEGKIFRMKELGLWASDEDGYYSDPNAKYMTYANPLTSLHHMEWNGLNNAFKLAKILNRKLILPKFHCQRPRMCPAERFGIVNKKNNCYCSIIHLLQDVLHRADYDLFIQFDHEHNNEYREHNFLDNMHVPTYIKQSISSPIFIQSELSSLFVDVKNETTQIFKPRDTANGPTRDELLKWFTPMQNVAVLNFHSFYGNIQL